MKELYKFTDKLGEVEHTFTLKKPSRTEMEEIEIFYAAMLSKLMNQGVQTRAAVDKYYADNTKGAMTKEDEKEIIRLRRELLVKEEELITSATDKEKRLGLYQEVSDITEKIRNYNSYYSGIYDNTAENKARDKTIDFCFLNFSYLDDKKLFESDKEDYSKRMIEQFEKFEEYRDGENGEFYATNFDKLVFLFTIWYLGAANTHEEFDQLLTAHYGEPEEEVVEETPEDSEDVKKED